MFVPPPKPEALPRNWGSIFFRATLSTIIVTLLGVFGALWLQTPILPFLQICVLGVFIGSLIYHSIFYHQVNTAEDYNSLLYDFLLPLGFILAGTVLATAVLAPAGVTLELGATAAAVSVGITHVLAVLASFFITMMLAFCFGECCIRKTDNDSGGDEAHTPARRYSWPAAQERQQYTMPLLAAPHLIESSTYHSYNPAAPFMP
jgi:glucan phosphoethanolaminetransferase (alkaline phosphatase superfamily)